MKQERFETEILPLRGRLIQYAYNILHDADACEDIAQDVMIKLWMMRNKLDTYKSVKALAFVITKHLCYNLLRQSQREVDEPIADSDLHTETSPEDILIRQEEENRLLQVISLLPDMQQSILRMKHIDGLEVSEIAHLTGSTPESIRMNLSRARKRIKEIFVK